MTDAPPLLDCRDLRKRYKELTAVDGVSFHIDRGETYGLLGPNGAGKTTTISMVCGLLERDGGSVTVAGRPMDIDATEAKALIGYVPQDLAIYPDLSARENLRFFGRLQRLGGSALDDARGGHPRADRPHRAGQRPHGGLLGRHEAAPQHRHRPAPRAAAARPRRAHRGRRPAEPQRHPGGRRGAAPGRHVHPLHDALHGGGRAALRPHRHHRRGPHPGRGHAPRAGGPGRAAGPRHCSRPAARWPRPRAAHRAPSSASRAPASRTAPSRSPRRGPGRSCRPSSARPPTPAPSSTASRSPSRTWRPSSCTSPGERSGTRPAATMRAALLIAAKDLRQKLRDRSAILVGIVAPFALAALFSSVLGGLEEDFHARWAFVDLDGGEVAAALEQGALAGMEEAGVLTLERLPTAEAARAAVARTAASETAIIVPAGFSAATLAGSGTEVELVVDPDASHLRARWRSSVLDGFARRGQRRAADGGHGHRRRPAGSLTRRPPRPSSSAPVPWPTPSPSWTWRPRTARPPSRPTTRPPWPSSSSSSPRSSASSACTRSGAPARWPACWPRRCAGGPSWSASSSSRWSWRSSRWASSWSARRSCWGPTGATRSRWRRWSWRPPSPPPASPSWRWPSRGPRSRPARPWRS